VAVAGLGVAVLEGTGVAVAGLGVAVAGLGVAVLDGGVVVPGVLITTVPPTPFGLPTLL
jgi:hypothetical protein